MNGPFDRLLTTAALAGSALILAGVAAGGGPVDLFNGGSPTESVGELDNRALTAHTVYQATTFPLAITFRTTDALWGGVQVERGEYRFVQLQHRFAHNAQGKVIYARGDLTLEMSVGRTPSVASVVHSLHANLRIHAGAIHAVHVAGYPGLGFDATITRSVPGQDEMALVPFSGNPTLDFDDHKAFSPGQLIRVMAVAVKGKTVVIYLQSVFDDHTQPVAARPAKTFPVFLGYANHELATLTIGR